MLISLTRYRPPPPEVHEPAPATPAAELPKPIPAMPAGCGESGGDGACRGPSGRPDRGQPAIRKAARNHRSGRGARTHAACDSRGAPAAPRSAQDRDGTVGPPEALSHLGAILKSPEPVPPDRFVNVDVQESTAKGAGLLHNLSLGRKHDKHETFIAPAPIRQDKPAVPPELRRRITGEVSIDVKVFVDRAGKVEYAELLSNGTGANRDLASLAVFSSRRWQFSPASRDGAAVPAEVVLRFRFGGGDAESTTAASPRSASR